MKSMHLVALAALAYLFFRKKAVSESSVDASIPSQSASTPDISQAPVGTYFLSGTGYVPLPESMPYSGTPTGSYISFNEYLAQTGLMPSEYAPPSGYEYVNVSGQSFFHQIGTGITGG